MSEVLLNIGHSKSGYGFYFTQDEKKDKRFYISSIIPESPAEESGLMEGDIVLSVDNYDFTTINFNKAVKKIKKSKKKIQIKVLRNEKETPQEENPTIKFDIEDLQNPEIECEDNAFQSPPENLHQEIDVTEQYELPTIYSTPRISKETVIGPVARLFQITLNESESYGFTLRRNEMNKQHILTNVIDNSLADMAGIKNDDILIEVNDINVENLEHETVVDLVRESTGDISLLVVDQESYDYFMSKRITISSNIEEIQYYKNFKPIERTENESPVPKSAFDNECEFSKQTVEDCEPIIILNFPEDIIKVRDRMDMRRMRKNNYNNEYSDTSTKVKALSQM